MIARRRLPVKQNPQSFLHCRKIAENRRKTQKRCNFNLQIGCGVTPSVTPELPQSKPDGFASSLWEGAFGVAGKFPAEPQGFRAFPLPRESSCPSLACRDAPLGQRQGGVFRLPPPYLWTPPTPQCNNCDRRQRRKQGAVVGAAASKTRVPPKARSGCWEPQPVAKGCTPLTNLKKSRSTKKLALRQSALSL